MNKKIIGIFVFMLLIGTVIIASGKTVNIADNEKIVFEKRMNDQKYTVFISGKACGMGGNETSYKGGPLRINLHWILYRFEPLSMLKDTLPESIYDLFRVNLVIVDGERYLLNSTSIVLENFTGWAPGEDAVARSFFIPFSRLRVFGVCDKIAIWPQGFPPA